MKRGILGLLLLLCLFITVPVYAAGWVLYDNFNSGIIDPAKWTGNETGKTGREMARRVVTKQLNLLERNYGDTSSDSGIQKAYTCVTFANSSNISAIKATVKLVKIETIQCDNNSTVEARAAAKLQGYFFNTGPQVAGSQKNDVYAWIGIFQDTGVDGGAWVGTRIKLCLNADCSSQYMAHVGKLGQIKEGEQAVLSVEWDKTNHNFIFQRDKQTEVVPYDPKTALTPTHSTKVLMADTEAPNCTSAPRPTGSISALFDNVYIKTLSP